MSKIRPDKDRNNIFNFLQRIFNIAFKYKDHEECSYLGIVTLPKVLDNKSLIVNNIDYMVGVAGNPKSLAKAMVNKAIEDKRFDSFLQELLEELDSAFDNLEEDNASQQ